MLTSAQNFAVVQTELDDVFYQVFDELMPIASHATARTAALFKPSTTTHAAYIEEIFKGSQLFTNIGETQTIPQSTPAVRNKLTIYIKDYAQGIELSKDFFDDNMHDVWQKTVTDFATVARKTQDFNAFGVYRNSFTTELTADGVAIISASHPLIGGGTQSNLISGALTATTLNDAMVSLMTQKNQAGVVMGGTIAYILVAPEGFKNALQVTESALISGSGNNDLNIFRSLMGTEVYFSEQLSVAAGGSATAWWAMSKNHSVTRLVRQGIETNLRDWGMSNNRTYYYQANFREATYCPDYAGIVGSTGV